MNPSPPCTIRPESPADRAAVFELHRRAFAQDAESELVDELRDAGFARVSLVAEVNGSVVGHILFSRLAIISSTGRLEAVALGPMAVVPEFQRRGIGAQLVKAGLDACRSAGHRIVAVLGHAAYYPRFGFSSPLASGLASPFGGGESWMALELVPGALAGVTGSVEYAPPFVRFL